MTATDATSTAGDTGSADALPRWDLTPLFATVDAPEVAEAEARLASAIDDLAAAVRPRRRARHRRRDGGGDARAVDAATFDEVLADTNDVLDRFARLEAFAYGHVSTDSGDEAAQALLSRLRPPRPASPPCAAGSTRGSARSTSTPSSPPARPPRPTPGRSARRPGAPTHQMSEPEESLAAELGVTGSSAWGRLYEDVSAGVTATVEHADGRTETLPIFAVRGLATHPDAAVREAAFRAELVAWQANATPIAAALNAIKGETLALGARRGWGDPLSPVLEASAVERAAFDAMQAAVDDSLADFRRYLAAKARLLGKERCAFWDLFAPVGDAPEQSWPDATATVERAFAGYGDDLAGLAGRALAERWVDAGPRAGKVGGAFCMHMGDGASRVLMNFAGSIDAVHTLAHELGHAYHNAALASRTPMQR